MHKTWETFTGCHNWSVGAETHRTLIEYLDREDGFLTWLFYFVRKKFLGVSNHIQCPYEMTGLVRKSDTVVLEKKPFLKPS